MKSYTVTGLAAGFAAGLVLALDADQVARRAHAVRVFEPEALGLGEAEQAELRRGGRIAVRVLRDVEFKRGETVGVLAGGLGKALVQAIAPADAPAAQAARDAVLERRRRGAAINEQRARAAGEVERDRAMRKATGANLRPQRARKPAPQPAGLAAGDTAARHKAGEATTASQGVVVPNPPEQTASMPSNAD